MISVFEEFAFKSSTEISFISFNKSVETIFLSLQNPPHNFKSQINFSFICGHEEKHLIDLGISFHSAEIIMKKLEILILLISVESIQI